MSCPSRKIGTGEKTWAETETKTGHIHDRLCTQVMYEATKENMCRGAAIQAQYACKGGRGSEGRRAQRENGERGYPQQVGGSSIDAKTGWSTGGSGKGHC